MLRIKFGILLIISILLSSCSGAWYIGFLSKLEKFEFEKPQYRSFDWEIAEHPGVERLYIKAKKFDGLRSVLVVKNGTLVAEWYTAGFNKERAVNVKSVSKSIISALVGIAIEKGYIKGIDQPIFEILPEFFPLDSPEKRAITIKHLLTMSAGFEFIENVNNYVYFSDNWTKSILKLPLSTTPGSGFNYGTIQTHLLSAVLTKVSGMDTLTFAQTHLLNHMRISINRWDKAPEGTFFGGSEMYLTPK
jgi:CubicO group peptidase (beta-lactamase class C family)